MHGAATIRSQFEETGVVRLDGAFDRGAAERIRGTVWHHLERAHGIDREDRSTWPASWSGVSWRSIKKRPVFDVLVQNPAVRGALDAIFSASGGWREPKPGAQVLFNLPAAGPWVLPDAWHIDTGFGQATWPVFAVKLFGFFGRVDPGGGGTMILPGTHRVVDHYRGSLPPGTGGGMVNWRRFMRHDAWLASLLRGEAMADGGRSLVGQRHDVGGVPVEVLELTGEPGDVVITHLHVFHTAAPNASARPRQMLGKAIYAGNEGDAHSA